MGSFLVVLEHPPVGGLADVFQADEQVHVQQLIAQCSIEPLNVGVLVGLPGLDVLDCHPGVLCPLRKRLSQELRAIVGPQDLWQTSILAQPLKNADQTL
jgi:hypothetical protein